MSPKTSVEATINVTLRPWMAPYFATRLRQDPSDSGIPIKELSVDALDEMAFAWLQDLYHKAGRRCPFNLPAQSAQDRP